MGYALFISNQTNNPHRRLVTVVLVALFPGVVAGILVVGGSMVVASSGFSTYGTTRVSASWIQNLDESLRERFRLPVS